MKIEQAVFSQSNTDYRKCIVTDKPEYAFIGRSNVGKSSLINRLTNQKGLAKTSQTPGKTKLINHFLINNAWYLVDLPGYGFAKISKTEREKFEPMIYHYLKERQNLICTFVLIDCRLAPQAVDLAFMQKLGAEDIPFMMIFTKADKLSKTQVTKHLTVYREKMLEVWEEMPQHFVSSAVSGDGRDEILKAIEQMNFKDKEG
jgi:GTP-binding protein